MKLKMREEEVVDFEEQEVTGEDQAVMQMRSLRSVRYHLKVMCSLHH